jgi:hypothetical protein
MAAQSGLSNYAVQKLLNKMFGGSGDAGQFTPPTTWYVACFITGPNPDGTGGTEVSASGYARTAVTNGTTNFAAISGTSLQIAYSNAAQVILANPTAASWGNVSAVAWYDASTAGNYWWMTVLGTPQTIPSGAEVYFNQNDATLTIN